MQSEIIKAKEIRAYGLSRSSAYRLAKEGQFPKLIKLSERSSGWLRSEVEAWLAARVAASRKAA
jgi:prophage regulatory protein